MKTIFKLMVWMMLFNFMTGIMIQAFTQISDSSDPGYNSLYKGTLEYKAGYENDFIGGMNGTINPTSSAETKSDTVTWLLNVVGLAYIMKIINVVLPYTHGLSILMDSIFGGMMNEGLRNILFNTYYGIINMIINILYFLAVFYLITGKSLTED